MTTAVGIDVAKAKLDVALLQADQVTYGQFDNTPKGFAQLKRWLDNRLSALPVIGLEATGHYSDAVAHDLYEAGYTVYLLNPAQVKAYARSNLQRTKTDKGDADLIARFCLTHDLTAWVPLAPHRQTLREMVRYWETLLTQRHQLKNRLHAKKSVPPVVALLTRQLTFIEQLIAETERTITDWIRNYPDLQADYDLLGSIPGVGPKTIFRLLAEVDLHRFDAPAELVAYLGLNPRLNQSGQRQSGYTPISKTGHRALRQALYFPAIVAKQHNPLVRQFYERLLAQGKTKKSAIVAAMRKLVLIIFGVWKSRQPFDPQFRQHLLAVAA